MNLRDLHQRLVVIEGTRKQETFEPKTMVRRALSEVKNKEKRKIEYEDFFDFEEDLAQTISSRELAKKAYGAEEFLEESLVEKPDEINEEQGMFFMEELPMISEVPKSATMPEPIIITEQGEESKATPVGGVKKCAYIKRNKKQCRKNAQKNKDVCEIHEQVLLKKKQK